MAHDNLRQKAISLRKRGYSYSHIQSIVPVSKSTISYWLSGIEYVPNKTTIAKITKARIASSVSKNRIKNETIINARNQAKRDIESFDRRDLFMLGIGLYIGEGTKSYDQVRIINSDPKIVNLGIRWLKEICGLSDDNLAIRIHMYPDNNVNRVINFWSRSTGLSKNHFQKPYIDRREGKKISKKGKLPFGTAHLKVKSNGKKEFGVLLSRRILAWIDRVLE